MDEAALSWYWAAVAGCRAGIEQSCDVVRVIEQGWRKVGEARGAAREQHRRAQQENALSDHPRHMDDFDEGFNAGAAWAREQEGRDDTP